jgi:hypothetical protein
MDRAKTDIEMLQEKSSQTNEKNLQLEEKLRPLEE